MDPAYNDPQYGGWETFARAHYDAGIRRGLTRVFLPNAWYPLVVNGRLPMKRPAFGQRFDCFDWDEDGFFTPLGEFVTIMNRWSIVPIL